MRLWLRKIIYFIVFLNSVLPFYDKNWLLFNKPTLEQLVVTITIPVKLKSRTVVVNAGYQMNFQEPDNQTQIHFDDVAELRSAQMTVFDRQTVYQYLQNSLNNFQLDGNSCILRLICELAKNPIENRSSFLIQDILHFLFTPSEDYLQTEKKFFMNETVYLQAEQYGREDRNCQKIFRDCDHSILGWFTRIIHF